ncbi:hypothetical protein [Caldilinea sp.]|uniref:hypothetical protein n=1 Tax=Caldilinea sp. TaxID=2293560 RepID=UPI002C837275|nr:hypothetical protein [Anaerolineales bacterium]HQY92658.1 hypothetical protein [Caldilinea sp.]HRA65301.1 hypothetical protein [Caldilinea sp.]
MTRLLLLLFSSILFAGSIEAAATLPVTIEPPFRQVLVEQGAIAPGQEQAISVTLDQLTATTTILQLTITYPDGETQDVLKQMVGSTATLSWLVPTSAPAGMATFRLVTSGCGCGDRSGLTGPTNLESVAEGYFFVQSNDSGETESGQAMGRG